MESVSFKCAMSTEDINKQKKYDTCVAHFVLPILAVLMFVVFVFLLVLACNAWSDEPVPVALIATFAAVVVGIGVVYLALVAIEFPGMTRDCYDILETKTFAYDAEKSQFVYTDKHRHLRFSGHDVQKWVSVQPHNYRGTQGSSMDILRLKNGEQIVLEGKYNPSIHTFLNTCRFALYLPVPQRNTSTINFYEHSI